jgi:hypothetical protein
LAWLSEKNTGLRAKLSSAPAAISLPVLCKNSVGSVQLVGIVPPKVVDAWSP